MVRLSRLNTFFHLNSQPLDIRATKHRSMGAWYIQNLQFSGIILPTSR